MDITLELFESLHVSDDHNIKLYEGEYRMVHLAIDADVWGELMIDYVINRMKCDIDFSLVHDDADDIYSRFLHNLPKCLLREIVNVKVALKDFLVKKNCLFVEWNDLSHFMDAVLDTKNSGHFILMLRCYSERYHPNLLLKWCLHSKMPYKRCECDGGYALVPKISRDDHISVNILTLYSDYHLYREKWWR